jgi:CsoR family transcriptional regulator, copper-sensing transcriptional repressor
MMHSIKKKTLRRLKILEGQIRGLQRMVEAEEYCIDILNQSSAVKQALSSIEDLILENHLSTHVLHQMQHGEGKKSTREIMEIYMLAKRK